jgi:tripartite-type tricarboxylate transporter receptor subunit TctC
MNLSSVVRTLRGAAVATLAVAAVAFAGPAQAAYPDRPITIVVGAGAGGGNDIAARMVADFLSKKLGVAVVVENRPGASGARASEYFAGRPADGYTLLFGNNATQIYNQWLIKDTTYDPATQSVPVAIFSQTSNVLVANPGLGAKSVKELVDLAKSKPGELDYGSAGSGGSIHLAGAYFAYVNDIDVVHVPYKTTAEMVLEVISGATDFVFDNIPNSYQAVLDGKLTALAVASAERWPDLPDVPTMIELGYENFTVLQWYGIFTQTGTDPEVVKTLNTAMEEFLNDPNEAEVKLKRIGAIPLRLEADQYGTFLEEQAKIWRSIIDAAGVTAN